MKSRKYLPLHNVSDNSSLAIIKGDWVTVGVITHLATERIVENGVEFGCLIISDLNSTKLRLFLVGDALGLLDNFKVGLAIALLNAEVLYPMEKHALMGIYIDKNQKIMILGRSVDLGYCFGANNKDSCCQALDLRKGNHCMEHSVKIFKSARIKRQELFNKYIVLI